MRINVGDSHALTDSGHTIIPRHISMYCQPVFWVATSQGTLGEHEREGITVSATAADRTDPKEKKTERAVTRYCLPLGICSRRRVPSVGIEP